jgi:hypothetical protein
MKYITIDLFYNCECNGIEKVPCFNRKSCEREGVVRNKRRRVDFLKGQINKKEREVKYAH